MGENTIDQRLFRNVLGQYPTGVCVVTATTDDGRHAGFAVGSFVSISLDPPQVGFLPDKRSTSWPKIRDTGRFCVNILSSSQEALCRRFSSKVDDKFEGVSTRSSPLGSPIIDGVVGWVDCEIETVAESGDHYIVVGRVHHLDIEEGDLPLLFFQGGYGSFAPHSLIAAHTPKGVSPDLLRAVSLVRPAMERVADDLSARCVATAVVDGELIVLATAGSPDAKSRATLVGAHLPFTPPSTAAFAAWAPPHMQDAWVRDADRPAREDELRQQLARVRDRGYSVGLVSDAQRRFASALDILAEDPGAIVIDDLREVMTDLDYDPVEISSGNNAAIRVIAAPVFDGRGEFVLALTIYGFARPSDDAGIDDYIERTVQGTREATASLAGAAEVVA